MKSGFLSLFFYFLMIASLASSCHPSSLEEYREEGSEIVVNLIKELKKAQTSNELRSASPRLTRFFNDLTNTVIAAREFKESHPDADLSEPPPRIARLGYELRQEMERLYRVDGCREIIEKCQEEALFRLDAFEKKLATRMHNYPQK